MSPIPKPLSIPEMHRRLSNTKKVIVREKCVLWLLLGLTLFGIGFLVVHPSILVFISILIGILLCLSSSNRISRLQEREWMWKKDILIAENIRGEVETN